MALGAVVARIITQYSDKGSKAAKKDIAKLGKGFDDFSKRTVKAFAVATAAVAAFTIKIGKDAVQAAIADQKSQALLANSLRNTTGATNAAIASVENYISKLQVQVGVADDELRPALSKLAATTGDLASAQKLLGTALDVSAFSGADLGTATNAITKALQGNFKGLQNLVKGLDATSIKSKDLVAIFKQVEAITAGSAATRADTLEFRLAILRIRYNEIIETLGYQLLPIVERFAKTIQTKVLPQIEAWISANGEKLVTAFQFATDAAIKLIAVAISFSDWISNNTGLVKTFAAIVAGLFAVGKVAAFATVIGKLTAAFAALRASAGLAAVATAYATGGASVASATAALALVGGAAALTGGYVALKNAGNKARDAKAQALANNSSSVAERGRSATRAMRNRGTSTIGGTGSIYDALLKAQNALNNAKKKELTLEQKIINAMLKKYGLAVTTAEVEAQATGNAIIANLNKQKGLGISSPTISLLASANVGNQNTLGSGSSTPNINVNINTPFGTQDDFIVEVETGLNKLQRRRGIGAGGGIFRGTVAE
jgi:hypothetical protein